MKVAALFVKENSIYKTLGIDCYDEKRNACNYNNNLPVIAHPPCRLWSALRGLSTAPDHEKQLAITAVDIIRKVGGVLEHPARSTLFGTILPLPGVTDKFGGYSICVNMSWFNYPCQKKTLLYIVGCNQKNLPGIPIKFDAIQYRIGSFKSHGKIRGQLKELPKKMRDETPIDMAKWLIEVASRCDVKNIQR